MRDLDDIKGARCTARGADGGAFALVYRGASLLVVASSGMGWDHVSVSLKHRTPNWGEMEHVKRLFFLDSEVAMQLHVPPDDHISFHPYCLHLWRPQHQTIPRPPAIMPAEAEEALLRSVLKLPQNVSRET